jgi:hypothetical protein
MGVLAKILFEQPTRPSELAGGIPPALDELVLSMLAKERADRPTDGGAVLAQLDALALSEAREPGRAASEGRLTGAEQWLMSVVLGGVSDDRNLLGEATTLVSQDVCAARTALERAAASFGATLDWLANGTAIAVLILPGSALEQAARAARCALAMRAAACIIAWSARRAWAR